MKLKRIFLITVFAVIINFFIWVIFGTEGTLLQLAVPPISFIVGTVLFKKIFKLT